MAAFRILSYNLRGFRDADAFLKVIHQFDPHLIALQNTNCIPDATDLKFLADQCGYPHIHSGATSTLAFLTSNLTLKQVREYDLGTGASCMTVDVSRENERFLLFNLKMRQGFLHRPQQIKRLLGPDLLQKNDLHLPTLIVGDFFDTLWISGHPGFQRRLRRVAPLLRRGTYPACTPLFSCDRIYSLGGIRAQEIEIPFNKETRRATAHLPLFLTMEITSSRIVVPARRIVSGAGNTVPSPEF